MRFVEDTAATGSRWCVRTIAVLSGRHPARAARMAHDDPAILRLIGPLALILLAATITLSGLGLLLARQSDDSAEVARRQSLSRAIEALQAAAPDLADIEPKLMRILEQGSGLKGLHFEADPPADDLAVQSLIDRNGRIVGWFVWEPQRPGTALMLKLLPFAALVVAGLMGFAILGMWQLSRFGALLAKTERRLERLEREDAATGLPNHVEFTERLGAVLAARTAHESVALGVLELDNFGEVKDALGERGGEQVVCELAARLRAAVPADAVIARLRSDRFGLVLPVAAGEMLFAVLEAVRVAVARPVWINQVIQVTANIGFALAPRDGVTLDDLTRRAKLALRKAKRRGRGSVLGFTPEMERDFEERRFIRRELARALAAREFELHYQPIVKADGGTIIGVEALLRWHHPSRGAIPPALFVRIAEEAGLMDRLGEFVLRRALADAARWPNVYVSVKLSPLQVRDGTFVDLVAAVLAETKIPPARVVLEVTEGVLIDDPEAAKGRLEDLRRLGVRLALDDFGSGYSSLTYVQRLPFDRVKIDRGFVEALDRSANTGVIIHAIVALGRALGMTVLIEGVETEEQRVLLRLAGCHEMQGFLFAKPGPREEIDQLLISEDAAAPLSLRAAS